MKGHYHDNYQSISKNKMLLEAFIPHKWVRKAHKFGWTRYEIVGDRWYKFLSARPVKDGWMRYYVWDNRPMEEICIENNIEVC